MFQQIQLFIGHRRWFLFDRNPDEPCTDAG